MSSRSKTLLVSYQDDDSQARQGLRNEKEGLRRGPKGVTDDGEAEEKSGRERKQGRKDERQLEQKVGADGCWLVLYYQRFMKVGRITMSPVNLLPESFHREQ